jgi:hypothetical protein
VVRYSGNKGVVVNVFNGHNAPFLSGIGADATFTQLSRYDLSILNRGPFVNGNSIDNGISVNAITKGVGPTVMSEK